MAAVRATITHLYSLGRFQDVQVEADDAAGGARCATTSSPCTACSAWSFAAPRPVRGAAAADDDRALRGGAAGRPRAGGGAHARAALSEDGYLGPRSAARPELHDPERTILCSTSTPARRRASADRRSSASRPKAPRVLSRVHARHGARTSRPEITSGLERLGAERASADVPGGRAYRPGPPTTGRTST